MWRTVANTRLNGARIATSSAASSAGRVCVAGSTATDFMHFFVKENIYLQVPAFSEKTLERAPPPLPL